MATQELSPEELKRLKRDASIRAREDDFEKKRRMDEAAKREKLEKLKKDFYEQSKKREEDAIAFRQKQAATRAAKKANNERLNQKREECIAWDKAKWLERMKKEIAEVIEAKDAEDDKIQEALEEARERKREQEEAVRAKKRDLMALNEELDMMREEKDQERAHERYLKMIFKVDMLKSEAQTELESFLQNPAPVPLKQVLAGRLRPVPKVTELLAALKDQREDLEDLARQDVEMRATLRNQSLFSYVKDIQVKAEMERVRPPEPVPGDLGRSRGKANSKTPGSPGKKGTRGQRSLHGTGR